MALIGTGMIAATPWTNTEAVTVVFKRGVTSAEIVSALHTINGRILWSNPDGDIWGVRVESPAAAWRLYFQGAVYVSGSVFGMGCFSGVPGANAWREAFKAHE